MRGVYKLAATALMCCLGPGANALTNEPALSQFRVSPSLLPSGQSVPYLVAFDGSLFGNDSERLLPELLNTVEASQDLIAASNTQLLLLPDDVQPLIDQMKALDGRSATAASLIGLAATAPFGDGLYLSFAADTRYSARFHYDSRDEEALRMATLTGLFTGTELHSMVMSSGILTGELGLHYNTALARWPRTELGMSLKYQRIVLYERNIRITEYEENRLFDRGRDTADYSFGNVDVGLTHHWRAFSITAVAHDLVPRDFDGPLGGEYRLRPRLSVIAGADLRRATVTLNADLTPEQGFAHVPDRREAGIGVDVPVLEKLNLQAGYQYVDNDIDGNYWNLGFNYHLLDYLHLLGSVDYVDERQLGGNLRLQIFF